MLALRNVTVTYPSRVPNTRLVVVDRFSADFRSGEISVLVGPSGCGKSTLLNSIAGLVQPESGEILRDGLHESGTVGYVLQHPTLLPWRTIKENALLGAEIAGLPLADAWRRCQELFARYGLSGFEGEYPSRISGGMQQRVAIVRAVVSGAKILLLDEPFSDSDYMLKRALRQELSDLVADEDLTAVLVTHDLEEAVLIADRIFVLSHRPARVVSELVIEDSRAERLALGPRALTTLAPYVEQLSQALSVHQVTQ